MVPIKTLRSLAAEPESTIVTDPHACRSKAYAPNTEALS
jgi:predicted metallo-beta-lactamase superfamily hydrolase